MLSELVTGIVRGSHGIRGYMTVLSSSGKHEHFMSLKSVTLVSGSRRIEKRVEDIRITGKGVLVKLESIDTPEDAKEFRRWEIRVEREIAAPLSPGDFYVGDLIGCSLRYNDQELGEVTNISDAGQTALLEVSKSVDGRTVFVPFLDVFVGEVDLDSRNIELLVDWFSE